MGNEIIKRITACSCAAMFLLLSSNVKAAGGREEESIREPVLAGTWYPGHREELRKTIDAFLSHGEAAATGGKLLGLVVPHAGYRYSGQVAAHAYRLLKGSDIQRVVLIGPSHHARFNGASMDLHSGYKTPLGVIPVDRDFAKSVLQDEALVTSIPHSHAREHSLEIQVPFLQVVLPGVRIVPIVMGQQDFAACERLASSLVRVIGSDRKTLILASSDLSHFHDDGRAKSLDGEFIRLVSVYDPKGLAQSHSAGKCEACGIGPVLTALLACKTLGANRAIRLGYATSGDVTGDRSRVVGYFSAALVER